MKLVIGSYKLGLHECVGLHAVCGLASALVSSTKSPGDVHPP